MEAEGLPGGKHNVSDTAWAPVGAFARQSRPPTETQGTAPGNAFARQSRPPTETQGTAPGNVAAPAGGSAGPRITPQEGGSVLTLHVEDALQLVLLAVDMHRGVVEGEALQIGAIRVEARLVGVDHRCGQALAVGAAAQPHRVPDLLLGLREGVPLE